MLNLSMLAAGSNIANTEIGGGTIFIGFIIFILLEVLYHKVVKVYYFGFNGMLKEVILFGCIATVLAVALSKFLGSIFKFLLIAIAIIVVLALIGKYMNKNGGNHQNGSQK